MADIPQGDPDTVPSRRWSRLAAFILIGLGFVGVLLAGGRNNKPFLDQGTTFTLKHSALLRWFSIAAVFGDVLPESTTDDLAERKAPADESANDAWLRAQVPPHHG